MIRAGLVTFHYPYSIGAKLQAFALQEAIGQLGAECRIVDFIPPSHRIRRSENLPLCSLRGINQRFFKFCFSKRLREGHARFEKFSTNHYHLAAPKNAVVEGDCVQFDGEYFDSFDAFVCGSDQVWEKTHPGFYFLDFVPEGKRRIAYAPSFGKSAVAEADLPLVRERLEKFDALSVREIDGQKIIKSLTGREVPVVLDPTLLLQKEEWKKIARPVSRSIPERFVLLFTVQNTMPGFAAAKRVAKLLNLPIVAVDTARRLVYKPGLANFFDADPEEFLDLIDRADYVVTTSFHGTAFAVNYQKPFLTVCQNQAKNTNSRMLTLAKLLGLESRIIYPNSPIQARDLDCNFDGVPQRWASERNDSIRTLKNMLDIRS